MTKDSAHFILPEPQLVRIIAYTFDVKENYVAIKSKPERSCRKFMYNGTGALSKIIINKINILIQNIDIVNFLKDSYKLYL